MLCQILESYLHQDFTLDYGSPEGAVDAAVSEYPLEHRKQAASQWWDWNASAGATVDIRKQVHQGFGVYVSFRKAVDARSFMNMVYDKLVVSIREETGTKWKP